MKDKQIIEKLRLLQSVQPDDVTLRSIRRRIPTPIVTPKGFSFIKWLTVTPTIPLLSFAVTVFIFIVISLFSNIFSNALITIRLAIAPNHYEKAKIALTNLQSQIPSLNGNFSESKKIIFLSQSLSLANSEMSGLQLGGEKNKYSAYQCRELYESYHKDLMQIDSLLSSDKSKSTNMLVSEAEKYDL